MPTETPLFEKEKNQRTIHFPVLVSLGAVLLLVVVLALVFIRVPTQQDGETIPLWQRIVQGNNNPPVAPGNNSPGSGSQDGTGNPNEGSGTDGEGGGAGSGAGSGGSGAGGTGGARGAGGGGAGGGGGGGGDGGGGGAGGGTSESGTGSSCGDGLCTSAENCLNCPADCGSCPNTSCTDNAGICQSACGTGFIQFPDGGVQCQPNQICCVEQQGGSGSVCGNNSIETGEVCECGSNGICGDRDDNLNGQSCGTQGFETGLLYCNSTCTGFILNECVRFIER